MIDERRRGPDEGFVEFHAAGEPGRGEFRCSECRYGIAIAAVLPTCPMCGGTSWERGPWSRFAPADAADGSLPPVA